MKTFSMFTFLVFGAAVAVADAQLVWSRSVQGEASGSHIEGVQEAAERQAYGYADALAAACESQGFTAKVNVGVSCRQHYPAHWFSCYAAGQVDCYRN